MSGRRLCRLCISPREEYKDLYDESGQGNDVYDITLKYFDPMLLTPDDVWDSTVICMQCWHHISNFYEFQKTILQAQANLQSRLPEDVKENIKEVKVENCMLPNESIVKEEVILDNEQNGDDFNNNEDVYIFDNTDIKDDNPFSITDEDDMKPLILHIKKQQRKRKCNIKENNVKRESARKKIKDNKSSSKTENSVKNRPLKSSLKNKQSVRRSSNSKGNVKEPVADQIANDMDDNIADSINGEKKTVSDKTLEWDNFIAQWKPELECIHCATTVTNFALLRKHFRSQHPNEKFYARCCERRFTERFTLYEHIKLHLDPNIFKCHVCGKCSTSSSNLAKHIKELHTEEGKLRPFECNVCQKSFTSKTNLRIHMEVHESSRDHICSECGKGFPSEQRRKIHERMVHNVDRICDQCGKSFHGIYALKQHLLEHKGIEKTKWPCDICGAQLNSHSSRKRHKQHKHNDGSTAYICSECGKVCSSEPALLGHKRIAHMNELKYKCNYCEKAFKTPRNLREHMATHTGIDLYQCPHCPKTFKMSSNMHHHRKKVHPVEWAEGRINKTSNKINLSLVSHEIVI